MFESGQYVAEHVRPTTEEQVQPNGVDLRLAAVFEGTEAGFVGRSGTDVADRTRLSGSDDGEGTRVYTLSPGGYVVRYAETVAIPSGHVGFVYPRSSLMRNSCMLNTAVWDAGYEGRGEGLLQVHHEVDLQEGARIAQLVLAAADHEATYDGSYQAENLK